MAVAAVPIRRPTSGGRAVAQPSATRYVVANGYEADPGSATDRTLMETDPHGVLEGVALAAYAVGATRAYVAVRTDATVAVRRLAAALRDAEEAGLLGVNALGKGIELPIELRELQGAFCRRRGDRPAASHRGQARDARSAAAVPGRQGPAGTSRRSSATWPPWPPVPWIVTHGAGAFRKLGAADERARSMST